jgi:hypothetical protein
MAAGLGFKTFTTGEVLTAADTNGYLMQGVLVFASAAARDAAVTSPQEGQCCYLKDTDAVQTYSGSAWVGFDDSNAIQNSIVDAKGDIVAASGNDTPARLAVGSNGDTLVADSAESTGLRWTENYAAGKNKIINGDFNINQRAFSSTTSSATYTFDRWRTDNVGGTVTYSAQTFTPGAAPVAGYEGTNFIRVATTGQSASSDLTRFQQRIEDVRTFAGQTVTVSFWAKAASGTPSVAPYFGQVFGSGGSTQVNAFSNKVAITTSWARYSVTISLASVSGKTIGTGSLLVLYLTTSAGSDFNDRTNSLGIQNATIDIWGVQVEDGSVATAFQTATGTLQGELAACQRYYWRGSTTNAYGSWGGGSAASTTQANVIITLPVTMRTSPASVDFSTLRLNDTAVANAATNVTLSGDTSAQTALVNVTGTGLTTYRYNVLQNNNSTSGYIGFSAEL